MTWMNDRLFPSVMNLNLILPPVHRRRETSAKGWKVFLSGSDPGWLGWLGAIGHQCEISDSGRRPRWARALSLRLRLGSQFLATLYLSLMGKLNIQPIKDGHVYLLLEAWERDWLNSIKTKKNLLCWYWYCKSVFDTFMGNLSKTYSQDNLVCQ